MCCFYRINIYVSIYLSKNHLIIEIAQVRQIFGHKFTFRFGKKNFLLDSQAIFGKKQMRQEGDFFSS